MGKKKTIGNDDGCKVSCTTKDSEWEKHKEKVLRDANPPAESYSFSRRIHKPALRVNQAKGHYYVQYKNSLGHWDTLGELNARNLGLGFGMMMKEVNNLEKTRVEATGIKKGAVYNRETEREFEEAIEDWEAQLHTSTAMFKKRIAKVRKDNKKAMKKLIGALKIPKAKVVVEKEGMEKLLRKNPEEMTPDERDIKKAFDEGRVILE